VHNRTSADVPRRRVWTSDVNKRLHNMCHNRDVFLGAVGGVNVLHNNVPDGQGESPGSGGTREKSVDSRDPHAGLRLGVEPPRGPVLGQRLVDGDTRAMFDPGDDRLSWLTGQGNSPEYSISGLFAHGYDGVLRR